MQAVQALQPNQTVPEPRSTRELLEELCEGIVSARTLIEVVCVAGAVLNELRGLDLL